MTGDATSMSLPQPLNLIQLPGSKDGQGAADHDHPYRFGRRPSASAPFPFSTREYRRLLVFRGRVQDLRIAENSSYPSDPPSAA